MQFQARQERPSRFRLSFLPDGFAASNRHESELRNFQPAKLPSTCFGRNWRL